MNEKTKKDDSLNNNSRFVQPQIRHDLARLKVCNYTVLKHTSYCLLNVENVRMDCATREPGPATQRIPSRRF